MIKGILVINNHGKPRLTKFYEHLVAPLGRTAHLHCLRLPRLAAGLLRVRSRIGLPVQSPAMESAGLAGHQARLWTTLRESSTVLAHGRRMLAACARPAASLRACRACT